jgi:DinB superfamily
MAIASSTGVSLSHAESLCTLVGDPEDGATVHLPTQCGYRYSLWGGGAKTHMDPITLSTLAGFPQQLEAHYGAVPEAFTHWAPPSWDGIPSERFTAIEQVCHVRDIEINGYHVRLRRTLRESNPVLPSIDSETLARERSYGTSKASEALAAFRSARAETIELISRLTPEQFARTAVFEGYGALSLRSLVHYLCSHDQQHLAGMQWLLGKIEAARVRSGL